MNDMGAGTLHLPDGEFVAAFESGRLPKESFHHADHIRLAWTYLQRMPEADASARMAESIERFAAHIGKAEKFHVTMTRAWMHLVAAALNAAPGEISFSEFVAAHPRLLDQKTFAHHYSEDLLSSADARRRWAEPDLLPLP